MQFCYEINNENSVDIDISKLKKFVTTLYRKTKFGDSSFSDVENDEDLPFVVVFSKGRTSSSPGAPNENDKVCISMSKKGKKVLEKINDIHSNIKSSDLKFSKDVTLSKPTLLEIKGKDWYSQCDIDSITNKKSSRKWETLEHNGPYFAHLEEPYKSLGAKLIYDGEKYKLNPKEEQAAGLYAKRIITESSASAKEGLDYTKDSVFNDNYWNDFKTYLSKEHRSIFKDFSKFDFSDLVKKIEEEKERSKSKDKKESATKKESAAKKTKTEERKLKFSIAILNGVEEKIGNYNVEPMSIFLGRGKHPKRGKIKGDVFPEDVVINIGENDPVPVPPEGHGWKDVVHNHCALWLSKYEKPGTNDAWEMRFANESSVKGTSDLSKYEISRKLNKYHDVVVEKYMTDVENTESKRKQQLGTVLYLIDNYGLRVGGEKDEEKEADTVGASTLKVSNITIEEPEGKEYPITLDFLGKDSVHFHKDFRVPEAIYNNFKEFTRGKKGSELIFNLISANEINTYLKTIDREFKAKVFRTRLASIIMYNALKKLKIDKEDRDNKAKVKLLFNKANANVAEVLNHTRTASKKAREKVVKDQEKLKELEKERKKLKKEGDDLDKIDKKIQKQKEKIESKTDTLKIAITTSLQSYIDPRLVVAWCKKNKVKLEFIYTSTLMKRFKWAISMTDKDWDYVNTDLIGNKELNPISEEDLKKRSRSVTISKGGSRSRSKSISSISSGEDEESDEVRAIRYTDRSILVKGDTKSMKDQLKEIGGKWNPTLKGWIFSIKKEDEIKELGIPIASTSDNEDEDEEEKKEDTSNEIESEEKKIKRKRKKEVIEEDYNFDEMKGIYHIDKPVIIKGKSYNVKKLIVVKGDANDSTKRKLKELGGVWSTSLKGWLFRIEKGNELKQLGIDISLEDDEAEDEKEEKSIYDLDLSNYSVSEKNDILNNMKLILEFCNKKDKNILGKLKLKVIKWIYPYVKYAVSKGLNTSVNQQLVDYYENVVGGEILKVSPSKTSKNNNETSVILSETKKIETDEELLNQLIINQKDVTENIIKPYLENPEYITNNGNDCLDYLKIIPNDSVKHKYFKYALKFEYKNQNLTKYCLKNYMEWYKKNIPTEVIISDDKFPLTFKSIVLYDDYNHEMDLNKLETQNTKYAFLEYSFFSKDLPDSYPSFDSYRYLKFNSKNKLFNIYFENFEPNKQRQDVIRLAYFNHKEIIKFKFMFLFDNNITSSISIPSSVIIDNQIVSKLDNGGISIKPISKMKSKQNISILNFGSREKDNRILSLLATNKLKYNALINTLDYKIEENKEESNSDESDSGDEIEESKSDSEDGIEESKEENKSESEGENEDDIDSINKTINNLSNNNIKKKFQELMQLYQTESKKYQSDSPKKFINFMRFFSNYIYIKSMMNNPRYTEQDIMKYDLNKNYFTNEIVLESRDAISHFYKIYASEHDNDEWINRALKPYEPSYFVSMFQRLYKKYINKEFKVNDKDDAFPDIIIL